MELKAIEYTGTANGGMKVASIAVAAWLLGSAATYYFSDALLYSIPILFGLYTAAFFFILYRRYKVVGKINLEREGVRIGIAGEDAFIPARDVERIFLRYTNCRRSIGSFTNPDANFIDIVSAGGHENCFQFVIEGKREKERIKAMLDHYGSNGTAVTVQSVVGATWREF